ncbi:pseudouridine synthase [Meira miltonrushii]|uniref:tRNA pseudouridine(55) synthase n=1 Tax=Meira miltonrushii TaxID=1280837 RepID=A0A316VD97_9BASI|nr:pseudouridine synthase [Meira miltonrushii]PWN34223.1 pseudouridine synthase [Meira miltonrushii]
MTTSTETEQVASSAKVEERTADKTDVQTKEIPNKPLKRSLESNKLPSFPVSGIFGIVKPSGPSSMQILDKLKPMLGKSKVFQSINTNQQKSRRNRRGAGTIPKIGQGGTLDPLADGVLVVGIGAGTKKLQQFLDCSKEYRTVGLLGCSTLSYDSEDPILEHKPFDQVKAEGVKEVLREFEGDLMQFPPLYSAVKIDGKRLLDYARAGEDLPRPIEARKITIHKSSLAKWQEPDQHEYNAPSKECSAEERKIAKRARRMAGLDGKQTEAEEEAAESSELTSKEQRAPAFTLDLTVSSGTYIRTIVHEVGQKLDSAAHVVKLTRTRQGPWVVPGYESSPNDTAILREAIEWEVLEKAISEYHNGESAKKRKTENGQTQATNDVQDDQDLQEWERLILERMEIC